MKLIKYEHHSYISVYPSVNFCPKKRQGAPFRPLISDLKQRLVEVGLVDYWTDKGVTATTNDMIKEEGARRTLEVFIQVRK